MRNWGWSLVGVVCLVFASGARANPVETSVQDEEPLLKQGPVTFTVDYKSDLTGPVTAEMETRPIVMGSLTLGAETDLEQMVGWSGGTLLTQGLFNHGGDQELGVGDIQGHSNIQSPALAKVYQLWLKQSLLEDRISFGIGLHDLNSEFYVTDSSVLFINSSFGIGPEFGQSGVNGPSIYPATSMAVLASAQPWKGLNVKGALYDGVAGDPEHPSLTRFYYRAQDGLLGVGEINYESEINNQPGKYGLGFWAYSVHADHLYEKDQFGAPTQALSAGVYVLGEQKIYGRTKGNPAGLYGFARAGVSSRKVNHVCQSAQLGVTYRAPFARMKDEIGFGIALALGGISHATEKAFELTYRANIFRNLFVQPDIQWILNPGLELERKSVFVASIRAQVQI